MEHRLLLVADIHDAVIEEEEIQRAVKGAQILAGLFLGDLSPQVMEFCRKRFPAAVFWGGVKGNHDDTAPFPAFVTPLHLRRERVGTLTIGGIDGCLAYKPVGHYLLDDAQIDGMLDWLGPVDVLITHGPPTVHARDDGVHFGSDALTRYLLDRRCRYLIHGHTHEDRTTPVGPADNPTYAISIRRLKSILI